MVKRPLFRRVQMTGVLGKPSEAATAHGVDPASESPERAVRLERHFVAIRAAGILLAAAISPLVDFGVDDGPFYVVLLVASLYNTLVYFYVVKHRPEWLGGGHFITYGDSALMGMAVWATGGIESPFYMSYFLLAIASALRFGRSIGLISAATTVASYGGAVMASGDPVTLHNAGIFALRVGFVTIAAVFTSFLTHRKDEAEAALANELRRTRALLQAAHAPATSLTVAGVLDAVLQQSCLLTEAEVAAVQLYRQNRDAPVFREHVDDGAGAAAFSRLIRGNFRARERLVESGQPVSPGVLAARAKGVPTELTEFTSLCAVPIPGQRGKLGLVAVATRSGGGLTPLHFQALEAFLARAALALQNARLYEQLQEQLAEVRSLHDQMIRAERLAAVGELAAKVAHELNNPLTAIHVYNSLLLEEPVDAAEQQRVAATVAEQVERAKRVVRDILDYSRPREPHPEITGLNTVLDDGLRLVRHAAQAGHVLIIEDYAGSLPPVKVDTSQMAQVITNLTLNAVQAMPDGGRLVISTGCEDGHLYARFRDTGAGIEPAHIERIFEPFFTTKTDAQGTGLGLPICRTLVMQNRGRMTVQSEIGQGSTFTIWLPPAEIEEGSVARHRRR